MDSDRELLELAAKAAGYTTNHPWNAERLTMNPPVDALVVQDANGLVHTAWNPLTDDGAALRLAVDLDFDIELTEDAAWAGGINSQNHQLYEWHKGDKYAATRRAIVRAAAELERQHAENQSLTTENKRLREAILRLRHWSMAGELPEYPAHLPPSQQQKTALKPVSKPLCRDCADFGPICPTTGLPCDGSGEKP